jgi:prevent-host-death family protein
MAQFSVDDATANLSRLIAEALAGGEIIITRGNVPVVRLVPTTPCGQRRFGALKGSVSIDARLDETLPDNEFEGWDLA